MTLLSQFEILKLKFFSKFLGHIPFKSSFLIVLDGINPIIEDPVYSIETFFKLSTL